ncbi:hypothetical protein [Verrucosispora sp. WMMC514]|uniref:hypothetical protein n=1 Tax=Verrucosispora sp. WMMC514 TaxID=3015156 RepID=UPI00248B9B10|nr:hypothetical protein [Verrucosispora sp. WMMC514]WBB93387.1 hypothetical protein O7597_10620 [Verrucosispora sp. WMMC514]
MHHAVGAQLPALLARWDSEPPAIQYALACLAALYPHHAHPVGEAIADMADQFDGTRPGAYLNLAHALVRGQDDEALAIATDIVGWEPDHDAALLDAPDVPAAVKASHILTRGALRVLSTTR